VWLGIALGLVGLGFVLLVLAALSSWRRFKKMRRAGGRLGGRAGALADAAALLGERLEQPHPLGADD
jgi:hypothetical protein